MKVNSAQLVGRPEAIARLLAQLPQRDMVEAELMSRSLHAFIRGAWHVMEPGRQFIDNWHIGAICEVLEAITKFELKNVVINIPPRTMKSLATCVAWPAWCWTRAASADVLGCSSRFLTAAAEEQLCTRDALKSRRLIESDWYQARWGHVFRMTTDQNVKTNYDNDKNGQRKICTTGGSVLGQGGDYRVIDDPHKTDTQEGEEVREKKLLWLREEFSTRYIDPSRNALVTIMQRLFERDMAGYQLAEGWADYHLCIPMRFEEQRKMYAPPVRIAA